MLIVAWKQAEGIDFLWTICVVCHALIIKSCLISPSLNTAIHAIYHNPKSLPFPSEYPCTPFLLILHWYMIILHYYEWISGHHLIPSYPRPVSLFLISALYKYSSASCTVNSTFAKHCPPSCPLPLPSHPVSPFTSQDCPRLHTVRFLKSNEERESNFGDEDN